MAYEMSQLDYLAMMAVMEIEDKKIRDDKLQEFTSEEFNDRLEAMDQSNWRIHPIYGCIHKDLFFVIDALTGVVEITEDNVELSDKTLATWEEGRKEQTFQTHDAS